MPATGKTSKATMQANQNAVIEALAHGATYEQAAQTAGVLPATVTRYASDPAFMARVQARRATIATTTAALLTAQTRASIEHLHDVMTDPQVSDSVRVRAAGLLLTEARAWRDADMEARLVALEQAIAEQSAAPVAR